MFDSLLGTTMPTPLKFAIAFLVVLALIGLTAWLVRRFGSDRLGGGSARGRQPRLAVIDAATIDGRRRLVLIRRDNIEHLLMIGGPSDVVVEQNIVRATAARELTREPTRTGVDALSRTASLDTGTWPLQPEPAPAPSVRPYRTTIADEPWLSQAEPASRVRPPAPANSLTGLAAELSTRLSMQSEPVTPPARPAPAVEPVRSEQAGAAAAEQDGNLAEMAQRLEAALRIPPQGEGRPPVTDPLAVPPPDQTAAPAPSRTKFNDVGRQPAGEPKQVRADNKAAAKHIYDNLEQEMASLLGRPTHRQ